MFGGFARWIGFLTMTASIAVAILLMFGFLWFAINIQTDDTQLQSKADGIVVLTGCGFAHPRMQSNFLGGGTRQAAS